MRNRKQNLVVFMLALLFVLMASPLSAHHSGNPHFDSTKPIEKTGVVTEFKLVNPHAYVYFDVKDENGEVANWNCETTAASTLRRNGWSQETFAVGSTVTIKGSAARRDPHGCTIVEVTFADGSTVARNGVIGESVTANQVASAADSYSTGDSGILGLWMTAPRVRTGRGGMGAAAGMGGDSNGPTHELGRYADHVTDAGLAAYKNYDERYDDPALFCSPSSILRGWSEPRGISRVSIDGNTILIEHEFMDTKRVIHMTPTDRAADYQPSLTGFSVGRFEKNKLVITTSGIKAGVLVPHPGLMHSDELQVVETISLSEDRQQLVREYEATDPEFLKKPVTGTNRWNRTDLVLPTYACTELSGINNQRPEQTCLKKK